MTNVVTGDRRAPVVLVVIGTRPEAIKLAPVVLELQKRSHSAMPDRAGQNIVVKVCVTAQHRHMLDQVLSLFGIAVHHDLDIMLRGQTPTQVAAAVLAGLEPILVAERPDWVLVQGDTTTAAAGALAAHYARARVGHVEAGLRSGDKWHPFPEETNRRVVAGVADLHFAPTGIAKQNLLREGVTDADIVVTGNTVIDALTRVASQQLEPERWNELGLRAPRGDETLILVTAHRRENFGGPLENILLALREIAQRSAASGVRIVYPVHLNPSVWDPAHRLLAGIDNIMLVPPLDYLLLVHLMKRCHFVITDSGGIQEEAPGLGKPVLVLRDVTERPEAVMAGTVRLVGTDKDRIVAEALRLLEDEDAYQEMARAVNPYGDGHASERIVAALRGEQVEPFACTSVGPDYAQVPGALAGK